MTRLLFILAACPLAAQISVTCPAPGNVATVSVTDLAHPIIYVRIEPNPDNSPIRHSFPAPGFVFSEMQAGPIPQGIPVMFAATPGSWIAYYFQNSPYIEGPSVQFSCIAGPPPNPTTTPTPTPSPTPAPAPTASGVDLLLDGGTIHLVGVGLSVNARKNADGSWTLEFAVVK